MGCSPWGRYESDTTGQLHFHFSPPCIGEGNGNPLQCSCLENPRDGGAWSSMGSHRVGHDRSNLAAAVPHRTAKGLSSTALFLKSTAESLLALRLKGGDAGRRGGHPTDPVKS